MKKLSYLIVAIAILVMVVSVALAAPGGSKYVWFEDDARTCIMQDTGDGGVQYWWTYKEPFTFPVSWPWLEVDNDLIETSGTEFHCVGKPISSMTLDQAIKRGFDIIWKATNAGFDEDFYVKINWVK